MVNVGLLILYATTVLIYIIFLAFDAFGRDEPYGNLAYVVAVIPTNFLWVIVTDTVSIDEYLELGVDVTMVWTILILMWLIPMIRDMYFVKKKKKDFDDVAVYLIIGVIVQFIVSAILPFNIFPSMQVGADPVAVVFWVPQIFESSLSNRTLFSIMVTLLVIGVIIPMISDLRGEPVNMWILIIITAIFSLPLALICYLWLADYWLPLLFLALVLFFIVLLMLTRGGEQK